MGLKKVQRRPERFLMAEQNENERKRENTERRENENAQEISLRLSVGYATAAAEEISGDTAISSGLPDGSLALILSDGMGKGMRAAAESRAVARRLRKNLKSGMKPAAAIKEVNRYMLTFEETPGRYRSEKKCRSVPCVDAAPEKTECFATIDLLIIDRHAAKAKFYKMGAASSFLLRNGKAKKFEQAALPIGIIPKIRLNHIPVCLNAGDIVVMVSDGITEAAVHHDESFDENSWLYEMLESRSPAELVHFSARRLAREILEEAALRYADRERDDLTVAVVKIL